MNDRRHQQVAFCMWTHPFATFMSAHKFYDSNMSATSSHYQQHQQEEEASHTKFFFNNMQKHYFFFFQISIENQKHSFSSTTCRNITFFFLRSPSKIKNMLLCFNLVTMNIVNFRKFFMHFS